VLGEKANIFKARYLHGKYGRKCGGYTQFMQIVSFGYLYVTNADISINISWLYATY